jgi:TonB family protein
MRLLALLIVTAPIFLAAPAAAQLDRHAIVTEVQRSLPSLQRCYERMTTTGDPSALTPGRIVVEVHVRANGTVRKVKVRRSDYRNTQFERCVVRVASRLHFPAPGQAASFVYPFHFMPGR